MIPSTESSPLTSRNPHFADSQAVLSVATFVISKHATPQSLNDIFPTSMKSYQSSYCLFLPKIHSGKIFFVYSILWVEKKFIFLLSFPSLFIFIFIYPFIYPFLFLFISICPFGFGFFLVVPWENQFPVWFDYFNFWVFYFPFPSY